MAGAAADASGAGAAGADAAGGRRGKDLGPNCILTGPIL